VQVADQVGGPRFDAEVRICPRVTGAAADRRQCPVEDAVGVPAGRTYLSVLYVEAREQQGSQPDSRTTEQPFAPNGVTKFVVKFVPR
jgi:hypothetical protein